MADNGENQEPPVNADKRAGAAPDTNNQKNSSTHNRNSLSKGRESTGGNVGLGGGSKEIDRAKLVRERQQEERQRKLEELRQQALAAQKFREQREEERRRRIEELRNRESDRRNQVEERKRQLWEAERERREAIIRKNQEREARIEAKRKNERSHIVFAFGSSTPRMLEPADTGGANYWATRRATSTTNVMSVSAYTPTTTQSLTRRSSERELDGSKKRATSAGGLDRKPDMRMSSSMYEVFNWNDNMNTESSYITAKNKRASVALTPTADFFSVDDYPSTFDDQPRRPMSLRGDDQDGVPAAGCATRFANRRRTDLVPTLPSPREAREGIAMTPTSSSGRSSSAKSFTRSPGMRSGEVTPNSPSRPPSALSQQSVTSSAASSSVNLRPRTAGSSRRPRPASIAGTGMSVSCYSPSELKAQKDSKPPLPLKAHITPKKPSTPVTPTSTNASASKTTDRKSGVSRSARASPRVTPRATPLQSPGIEQPPTQIESYKQKNDDVTKVEQQQQKSVEDKAKVAPTEETPNESVQTVTQPANAAQVEPLIETKKVETAKQETQNLMDVDVPPAEEKPEPKKVSEPEEKSDADFDEQCDMSASMIQKIRITTEEEAKAALAERRRLAREQAEREAEMERLRLEEEARLEAERLRAEEEEQRRLEEETLRLAEEARKAEEQRLQQAIEEAKRREEEDRKRREEEARLKAEKEEAERKAREEAEKQRLEMVERLKKEEEERIARRKRVEAIMSRTRAKNQPNTPNKYDGNDAEKSKETSPNEENKPNPGDSNPNQDLMTASLISEATQQFITIEQQNTSHTESASNLIEESNKISNGTHAANGIDNSTNVTATMKPQQSQNLIDNVDNGQQEFNGHHGNGIDTQSSIALDNTAVKQNNVTNNFFDLAEFDMLSSSNNSNNTNINSANDQILLLADEDNINSNLSPTAMPFTPSFGVPSTSPFQESFIGKKQDNQLPDLLS